jgi:hypothetical protein
VTPFPTPAATSTLVVGIFAASLSPLFFLFLSLLPPVLHLLLSLLPRLLPFLHDSVDGTPESSIAHVLLSEQVIVDSLLSVTDDLASTLLNIFFINATAK